MTIAMIMLNTVEAELRARGIKYNLRSMLAPVNHYVRTEYGVIRNMIVADI